MTKMKLLSAALIAAAAFATPVLARIHHARFRTDTAEIYVRAVPGTGYARYGTYGAYGGYGPYGNYACIPAPRVGAFATQPWTDHPACEPNTAY